MANLITVRLQRNEGQPWGFRLQGGKDFSSPLVLQRVSTITIHYKEYMTNDILWRILRNLASCSYVRAHRSLLEHSVESNTLRYQAEQSGQESQSIQILRCLCREMRE